MSNTTVTIVFIPDITEVFVAEDGSNYCKIVTEELFQRHDDYSRDISVVPGVSRIKFVAVPDGVEHYYWKYSDDHSNDGTQIGEGVEMNAVVLTVPSDVLSGTRIYVEEGHEKVDYGYDVRNLYFKNDTGLNVLNKDAFLVVQEPVSK